MLAEVAGQPEDADERVPLGEPSHDLGRAVQRPVVHEHQLRDAVRAAPRRLLRVRQRSDLRGEGAEGVLPLEDGNHDRHLVDPAGAPRACQRFLHRAVS